MESSPGALILGASSGFGEGASVEFANAGYDIYGVHLDRRAGLQHVEEIKAEIEAAGQRALFFNMNAASAEKPEQRKPLEEVEGIFKKLLPGK